MKTRSTIVALAAKDLRVLAPVWLGTAAAMTVLATTSGWRGLGPLGAVVYALGCVALGAMAFGHEFRHTTMATLITLPVSRGRVMATKLAVLATLLALLGVAAWAYGGSVSPQSRNLGADLLRSDFWFVLPLLCGLGLAPLFTLVTRSELAGMVFAGAVPAVLLIGGDGLALMTYGLTPDRTEETRALKWSVVETGLVVSFAIGLITATRIFRRLELIEGRPLEAWTPGRRASVRVGRQPPPRRRPNAYALLAVKELRLQTPAVAVAALFVAGWVAVSSAGEAVSARIDLDALRAGFAGLYAVFVATLIGALASAEERQQGTLHSQLLVPMAAWRQWVVKVAVLVGLTAVLAFALPFLLTLVSPGPRPGLGRVPVVGGIALVFSLALYVSTLTTGGMRAFLTSVGVAIGGSIAVSALYDSHVPRLLVIWFASLWTGLGSPETLMAYRALLVTWVLPVPFVVLLFLLVRFAMTNHNRLDRPAARLGRQLGWFSAMLALVVLCASAAGGLARAASVVHRTQTATETSQPE